MKNQVEAMVAKIGKIMQAQLADEQFDSAANLSPLLSRARQLQKQCEKNEEEFLEIEAIIKDLSSKRNGHQMNFERKGSEYYSKTGRAVPQTIRIKIDWKSNKRDKDKEEIYSLKATEVMAEFIARLIDEFGKDAEQTLSQIRANRGHLLSRFPEKDYGAYQRKRVRGTDWFVLTHSSTPEKVELLGKVCRALGLVPGSVEIKIEDRFENYSA